VFKVVKDALPFEPSVEGFVWDFEKGVILFGTIKELTIY
jgi:hypothetical protein